MALPGKCSLVVFALAACLFAQQPSARHFTELAHLDADTIKLTSTGETLTFLGTWIAPELKHLERVSTSDDKYIRTVDGQAVHLYPETMTLRITVSKRDHLDNSSPIPLETKFNAEELAKSLHFRLRIYRGLEYRIEEPVSAQIIGVPAEVPYGERIYLVKFSLSGVPVEDRLMIEALDPQDHRVTRFSIALL
jgi:hypothetical protein